MKFIIPTDNSIESENAIYNLVPLMSNRSAEIILFHSVEPQLNEVTPMVSLATVLTDAARISLEAMKKSLEAKVADYKQISVQVEFGIFPRQLKDFVKSETADLVIIPSNRKSLIERMFVGQRSLEFIGEWSVPTLITPYDKGQFSTVKIGLAVDQVEQTDPYVDQTIQKIKNLLDAELCEFHIDDFTEDNFDYYLKKKTGESSEGHVSIIQDTQVEKGISKWCKTEGISMLAMVTHNKNFISKKFVHSTIRELVKENKLSILVLTKEEK